MVDVVSLALANLTSPPVLFFALGFAAALARSDLTIPDQIAKGLSLYLLIAIGLKGGAAARAGGLTADFGLAAAAGAILAVVMPLIAFAGLGVVSKVDRATRAAVAAHYGSISIVTFVAATQALQAVGLKPSGYMTAVAALMETPAILIGLALAGARAGPDGEKTVQSELFREVFLNGSVVVLLGAFLIGLIADPAGMKRVDLFVNGMFQGALCLFLLDLGLLAARRLTAGRALTAPLVGFGLVMPPIGAGLGLIFAAVVGMSPADGAILMTLAASASYIAAPAAMRIALPEADAGVYLPLALGVTFPFNLAIGVPLYAALAQAMLR
jgi:uncharacterized protein